MAGRLSRFFSNFFRGRSSAQDPAPSRPPESPAQARDRLYEEKRAVAHECGHAVVAWLSPAVAEVANISFHRDGSAATMIAFRAKHPELPVESALVHLGGLAGEVLVWQRVRSGGFSSDLRKAIGSLETYLKAAPVTALEARWRGRLAASSIDVAMMMVERPPPDVAAALNLCYRRAKYLLIEHRPAFLRLVALATRIGDLTADDIATQFGPRIWDRLR